MGCLELTIQDYFHVHDYGEKTAYSRFSRHVPIDPDGNMTSDGKWNYTWNGENRLIVAESADKRLEFTYDYMGRRVRKQVYTGSSGNWTLTSESKYVYDGWNCIAIFNASDILQKSYLSALVTLRVNRFLHNRKYKSLLLFAAESEFYFLSVKRCLISARLIEKKLKSQPYFWLNRDWRTKLDEYFFFVYGHKAWSSG